MNSGSIGRFQWVEVVAQDGKGLIDAIRTLRRHLIGLRAVNVSWDSGLLVPSEDERRQGWTIEQGRAISPRIEDELIEAGPWGEAGWEEWYFFSALPQNLNLSAHCNWGGLSIGDWPELVGTSNGFDLKTQLEIAAPTVVLGEGQRLFAITPNAGWIEEIRKRFEEI